MPIVLPIAALSMATHAWVFDRLLRDGGVVALSCAAPPLAYLQVPLLLQAALGAWFFGSAESVGAGAAVGVLALLSAAWFGCGGQAGHAEPLRLVVNERGVRLTMLQAGDGSGAGDEDGAIAATDYALMTT